MLSEWHGGASSVMPVWQDVHRTCGTTFAADKASIDLWPGAIRRQGVQPDVDQAIAAAVTLDVAGYVVVREPFRRGSGRVVAGHMARLSRSARRRSSSSGVQGRLLRIISPSPWRHWFSGAG